MLVVILEVNTPYRASRSRDCCDCLSDTWGWVTVIVRDDYCNNMNIFFLNSHTDINKQQLVMLLLVDVSV